MRNTRNGQVCKGHCPFPVLKDYFPFFAFSIASLATFT